MAFDFSSPYADAAGEIRQMMLDREVRRRQHEQDALAQDREERLRQHEAQQMQIGQAQLDSINDVRKQTIADQQRKAAEEVAKTIVGSRRMGDKYSSEEAATLRSTPGYAGAVEHRDTTQGAFKGNDANDVPQYDVKEGGEFATGTPEERKAKDIEQQVAGVLDANPEFRNEPEIQVAHKYAMATHEYKPFFDLLQERVKRKADAAQTEGVFSVDPKDGTFHQTGSVPKGSHLVNQPNPPQPWILNMPGYGPFTVDKGTGVAKPVVDAKGQQIGVLPGDTSDEWQNTISRVLDNMQPQRRTQKLATFGRLLSEGNDTELKDQIRQTAIEGENVDLKNQVMGRQTMRNSIKDVRALLADLKKDGVPTNMMSGSMEDLARWLGTSTNPQYVAMANRVNDMLITYRRSATGVAFGEKEQAEYAKMFPNYRQTLPVNEATLDGLSRSVESNDATYWTHKLGPQGAKLVMGVGADKDGGGNNTANAPKREPNETPDAFAKRYLDWKAKQQQAKN